MAKRKAARSPADRLAKLIVQRAGYRIFVGVPFASPKAWASATHQGEGILNVPGYGTLRVSEVRAFAVAYANGQLLDMEPYGLPMPEGLDDLAPASRADTDVLHLADLATGRTYLQVTYGPSGTHPQDRSHYVTTLKNISSEPIRILRFAGCTPSGDAWRLSTVTRQFYSAAEFREWYGLGAREWIEPGQSIADPNNYGTPPVLWAYYCESKSGRRFVAGEVLK